MHLSSYSLGTIRYWLEHQLEVRIVFIILKTENNLKSIFYEIYSKSIEDCLTDHVSS